MEVDIDHSKLDGIINEAKNFILMGTVDFSGLKAQHNLTDPEYEYVMNRLRNK